MIAKPVRHRSQAHLRWVATRPCVVCSSGAPPDRARMLCGAVSQVHHLGIAQPKARGLKVGDQWVVPLCPRHHDPNSRESVHWAGDERAWWRDRGVDPMPIAERLWSLSVDAGRVRGLAMDEAA